MNKLKGTVELNTHDVESSLSWFERAARQKIETLKKLGRPSLGWVSVYTPEEIIHAAGVVPFRITGEQTSSDSMARAALFSNICPYILSCLEEGIQNVYDFSQGIIIVNTCDARRRLYDAWKYYVDTPFVYMIDLPKSISPASEGYFQRQVTLFLKTLEKHFNRTISDEALHESISLWNRTRYLLQKLYDLRKSKNPPISGSRALTIVKAATSMDRPEYNEKLERLIEVLETSGEEQKNTGPRILLSGSYVDDTQFVELIEQSGATVVCDDLSHGVKYFDGHVDQNEDPVKALADYYLHKAPCAIMIDTERRIDHMRKLVNAFRADAVIYFSIKFCSTNLLDMSSIKDKLNESGIPVLFLEGERSLVNAGQLKTRIQAFLEMLH
jgi:bzd-type benzoyl-CoA reductase N subunit